MASWATFASARPDLAEKGEALLDHAGARDAFLATVRDDLPPRIHPVNAVIVDGRLLTFVIGHSAKADDLAADGRYALHAHQDPDVPHEFLVRGRARLVEDTGIRSGARAVWPFEVGDSFVLYELDIDHAVLGERATADDWPPRYTSWRPEASTR